MEAAGGLDGLENGDDVMGGSADGMKTFHEFLDVGSVFEAYGLSDLVLYGDLSVGNGGRGAVGERGRLRDVEDGFDLDGEATVEDGDGGEGDVSAKDDGAGSLVDDNFCGRLEADR